MAIKTMKVLDQKATHERIENAFRRRRLTTILLLVFSLIAGYIISRYMELSTNSLVWAVLGAILGLTVGYLWGMTSRYKEGKSIKKETKAEKLFDLAVQQEDQQRKRELLSQVLEKYPNSEWADKALEERMNMRK